MTLGLSGNLISRVSISVNRNIIVHCNVANVSIGVNWSRGVIDRCSLIAAESCGSTD